MDIKQKFGRWVTLYDVSPDDISYYRARIEQEISPLCDWVYHTDASQNEFHLCFKNEAFARKAVALSGVPIDGVSLSIRKCTREHILNRELPPESECLGWPENVNGTLGTILLKKPSPAREWFKSLFEYILKWVTKVLSR